MPGSHDYEEAISVWNAQVKTRPQVVVRARGVSDVLAAVKYATEHKIQLSVRGGGHSMKCLCEGLVIDLTKASPSLSQSFPGHCVVYLSCTKSVITDEWNQG